jgi:hypothetical protein
VDRPDTGSLPSGEHPGRRIAGPGDLDAGVLPARIHQDNLAPSLRQADQADAVLGDRHPARLRRIGRAGTPGSAQLPGSTRMMSPGDAASTAAWIDWPGRTIMVVAAPDRAGKPSTAAAAATAITTTRARTRVTLTFSLTQHCCRST